MHVCSGVRVNEFIKVKEHPADAARVFALICRQFQDILLGVGTGSKGLFGKVQAFYPKIEAQGRGTLHAHYLVWLEGAGNSDGIRQMVDQDAHENSFRKRLISWYDAIIHTDLPAEYCKASRLVAADDGTADGNGRARDDPRKRSTPAFGIPSNQEEEVTFTTALHKDAYAIAGLSQMHDRDHTATCFKRSGNKGKKVCRFGFEKDIVPETIYTDNFGIIGRRSNGWLNSYNFGLATTIRSNHDVK